MIFFLCCSLILDFDFSLLILSICLLLVMIILYLSTKDQKGDQAVLISYSEPGSMAELLRELVL